ncbi:MAG: FAD-dependent oxidoreductase, partial [Candidatus Sericytochromatia bacterium]
AGEKHFDFFVVLSGVVSISDPVAADRPITEHRAGQFTGDSDMLSERAALVNAVVTESGEVLRIPGQALKEMIKTLPEVSDILLNAFLLRREQLISMGGFGARLLGSRYSADTYRIREFFSRNHLPYTWYDVEDDPEAASLLEKFQIQPEDTPLLIVKNNQVYKNPDIQVMARCYGISDHAADVEYDLIVVGAGPAGLAASVYAASEGLRVLTVDAIGPGGQAGTSSKIENYLGFPTGISGHELATRAYAQVEKFGGTIAIPREVAHLDCDSGYVLLRFADGEELRSKALVIATGARYRKLALPELPDFEGKGVYYGATAMEAQTCANEEIILVGGGNSAGQGAVFLARVARKVHLLIRGNDLEKSMSRYLISRIEQTPNIELHRQTEISALSGAGHLESVRCLSHAIGESFEIRTQHVFSMIGALPSTDWVKDCVALDKKGFVLTGSQLTPEQLKQADWKLDRQPRMLETSLPGVYAVGDVRSDSTKRVASAVGEGSMCISFVHQFLTGT